MNQINKKLPVDCPSCQAKLSVKKLHCTECGTEVDGLFSLPSLIGLDKDDQEFILNFVLQSGSLKEMAKIMGRSYPLVRNRLDEVIQKLKSIQDA